MPPSHNFQQWNPSAVNQETDSQYTADVSRSGGAAVNSTFLSKLANKLFFQASTFYTAFAQMMVNKGYSPNDGSAAPATAVANLAALFANIMTQADMSAYALQNQFANLKAATGYQKLPGGLIINWVTGTVVNGGDDVGQTLPFALPFPTSCLFAIPGVVAVDGGNSDYFPQILTLTLSGVLVIMQAAAASASPPVNAGNGRIKPLVLAIGY